MNHLLRLVPKVSTFLRMPVGRKLLCAEAAFWLGIARLAVALVPFRRTAPYLGKHWAESPEVETALQRRHFRRVVGAIRLMSRNVPWECKCLAQCIAGKLMLNRRHVPCTMYLGLAKGDVKPLDAHAWLRTGRCYHLSSAGNDTFTVVATFA